MRHNEHRESLLRELHDDIQHLSDHLGIQRGGDLIKKHEFRMHGEGAHNRDALLLSAREHARVGLLLVGKVHAL